MAGALFLASTRLAHALPPPGKTDFVFLSEKDAEVISAVAPSMLEGAFPEHGSPGYEEAVRKVVARVDATISGLTPSMQDEVGELFSVLNFPPTRMFVAGVWKPWTEAGRAEITSFLESWQKSRFQLLRSGYDALHELITAAWYSNPETWASIGYPGPPDVGA